MRSSSPSATPSARKAERPRLAVRSLPPLLQEGFRPFFLGGALWAALAPVLWLAWLHGGGLPPSLFDPLLWHQHEMLFGYVAAVVAGFALTAVPNWTGRLPLHGARLGILAGLWLAGRIAVQTSAWIGGLTALLLDTGFLALLAALVGREIRAGRNWRNLPVGALLAVFAIANLLTHLEPLFQLPTGAFGIRLGLGAVLILIALIGGRVTPSFTRNWLAKRQAIALPAPFDRLDRVALAILIVTLCAWVVAPDSLMAGLLLVIAGGAHALRLARWRGLGTLAEPLVTILHVGYAWLPLGLILLGAQILGLLPVPLAALHALTAGAIGTMTLAIMTRASLGHTGRPLTAGPLTLAIYLAVTTGAVLRVVAPAVPAAAALLSLASIAWSGAFLLFALSYGPMLMRRREARSSN